MVKPRRQRLQLVNPNNITIWIGRAENLRAAGLLSCINPRQLPSCLYSKIESLSDAFSDAIHKLRCDGMAPIGLRQHPDDVTEVVVLDETGLNRLGPEQTLSNMLSTRTYVSTTTDYFKNHREIGKVRQGQFMS